MPFQYDPTDGLNNTSTYPPKPSTGAAARQQFMGLLGQIRDYINDHLFDRTGDDLNRATFSKMQLKDYSETLVTNGATTGTVTIDIANGNVYDLTMAGATTLVFSNPAPTSQACSFTLKINMPSTLYAITWPASIKWDKEAVPTFVASKTAYISFVTIDGGTRWHGLVGGLNFAT